MSPSCYELHFEEQMVEQTSVGVATLMISYLCCCMKQSMCISYLYFTTGVLQQTMQQHKVYGHNTSGEGTNFNMGSL